MSNYILVQREEEEEEEEEEGEEEEEEEDLTILPNGICTNQNLSKKMRCITF